MKMLPKIISKYPTEILGDDAVYIIAQIYDFSLTDTEKAMQYYQKILEEYPGSMWGVEARKRFRTLRGDSIN